MHYSHPLLPSLLLVIAASSAFSLAEAPPHRRYGAWNSGRIGGGGYLQHASFSKVDPNRLYLASDVGGFYRTDDGGRTWHMLHGVLPTGEGSTQIRGILAHPTQRDTFLIAAGSTWDKSRGIYRSDDAGASFTLTLPSRFEGNDGTRGDGFVLAADPSNPERVYAAPIGLGPQRSDDFGRTWRSLGLEGIYARDLVIDRANPERIWINAANRGDKTYEAKGAKIPFRHGLFVTTDGGTTWERLPSDETPIEMVQDPVDAGLLHAAFRKIPQLRRSRDGGRTWEPYANAESFPKPGDARADGTYAALATGPNFVLAGGHGGNIYRLPAGGDTWTKLPDPTLNEGDWYAAATAPIERHFGAALGFIAVSPHDPAHWLFTDWYACYLSPDAGATWNLAIDGIEMTVIHGVAQDPSNPARVHAGMADIGYFRSDDGGETFPLWGRHLGISSNIKHISVCQTKTSRLYAVGPITWKWQANQTFRSDDGGSSWTRPAQRGLPTLADEGGARCNTICVNPATPDEVFLVVSGVVKKNGGGVYRSLNAGDDWEWIGQGLPEAPLFRTDIWVSGPELAVSANGTLVAMSNDRGRGFAYDPATKQWSELLLPHANNCVSADPLSPGRFYAALKDAGLFRSDDGGRNWINVYSAPATYVTVDGAKKGRIAVTNGEEYWVSEDAGGTWREIGGTLPSRHWRNSICFSGNRLICGTGGSGIFWTDLDEVKGVAQSKAGKVTFGLKPTAAKPAVTKDVEQDSHTASEKTSLIKNGFMEEGDTVPSTWILQGGSKENKKMARDVAVFSTAPASLRIDVSSAAAFAQQRLSGNPGGKTLEVIAEVKTKGDFKNVQLVMQCFDASWKQVAWKTVGAPQKTGEWEKLSGKVSLPQNAYHVMFGLLVDGTGSAWLDGVAVSEPRPTSNSPRASMPTEELAPLPQAIGPTDSRLHFEGRWDWRDKTVPQAAWTASSVAIRFKGKNLDAKISTSNNDSLQVFIDGKDQGAFFLKGRKILRVASNLSDSEHTVELVKRTEPIWGAIRFEGFAIDQDATILPAEPRKHLILAIGDSVTAAYGNEAPNKESKFSPLTENGADAHAAFAARAVGADYTCVAWSGRKMWPNNTIGEVWPYVLPNEKIACDIPSLRKPDVVVIGFSGNDFSSSRPDEEKWTLAYADFIAALRRDHAPTARLYLFASPMTWGDENRAVIRRYIEKVVALRQQAGDTNISFLDYPMQNIGADGVGADWHPSVKTHRKLGEILASQIQADLSW